MNAPKSFFFYFNPNVDARVESFALIGSPFPIIGLIGVYTYFVTILGPRWMQNRKAYDLKLIINIYNLFQIFANLYISVVVSVTSQILLRILCRIELK